MTTNTNWGQSVTAVVIKANKVLLARHTYGNAKNMLVIPGGYVMNNETPQDAVKREFLEEFNAIIEPKNILAVRFNMHDWYIVFSAKYISGEIKSDNNENNEALWLDINTALLRDDIPELTKTLIKCALKDERSFKKLPYEGNPKNGEVSLYGV